MQENTENNVTSLHSTAYLCFYVNYNFLVRIRIHMSRIRDILSCPSARAGGRGAGGALLLRFGLIFSPGVTPKNNILSEGGRRG